VILGKNVSNQDKYLLELSVLLAILVIGKVGKYWQKCGWEKLKDFLFFKKSKL